MSYPYASDMSHRSSHASRQR